MEAETVKTLAYFFLAVGVVCGLALIYAGRPWVAVFGFLGLLAGFCYSASPIQLMSLGLGEIFIFWPSGHFSPWGHITSRPVSSPRWGRRWASPGLPHHGHHLDQRISRPGGRPGRGQTPPGLPPGTRLSRGIYAGLMLAPFLSLFFLLEYFLLPDLIIAALVALPLGVRASVWSGAPPPTDPAFVTAQALPSRPTSSWA